MPKLTTLTEWQALARHQADILPQHMRDWFLADQQRFKRYSIQSGDILLDYSRQRVTDHTLELLIRLAQAVDLKDKISDLFNGSPLNATENRAALHTALRDTTHSPIYVKEQNVAPLVSQALDKMHQFCTDIHSGAVARGDRQAN